MDPALSFSNRNKSIATRTLVCVAFVCFVLGSVVIVYLMVCTLLAEAGKEHTIVY